MSITLPLNSKWSQPNNSDKFGSLAYTKNINLDEEGYIKLSPRTVCLMDDDIDNDFNIPVSFGRTEDGTMEIVTVEDPFTLDVGEISGSILEDTSSDNPNYTTASHGVWWQGRWYTSGATTISYKSSTTWTADVITGLTSGKRHYLCVFATSTLLVTNGNVIAQYNTSHSTSGLTQLTIPSDFETIGLAYNAGKVGIITRLGSDTSSQNQNSKFYIWDGYSTSALGYDIGAYTAVSIKPYQSSFIIFTSEGQILYWNGGGFQELINFPFYSTTKRWGDLTNFLSYGDNLVVDGGALYLNTNFSLTKTGRKGEYPLVNNPSGVWCYDPSVGLYHRWSPSISKAYFHNVTSVDTATNIFTTSVTIPSTGNPVIFSSGTVGGLKLGNTYYVIKVSDTTFKLSETKDLSLAGVAIDITSYDTNQYFWMYDLVDYAQTRTQSSGGLAIWGLSNRSYQDVIFGGRYFKTDLTTVNCLCSAVPFLENRGYFVVPKTFTGSLTDTYNALYIKHRPLGIDDKIIVKYRTRNVYGLPTYSPNDYSTDEFIWTGKKSGYTNTNLSEAKTLFDGGEEIEIEFIAGVGAGQMVKVSNIDEENGVYSLVLEEEVIGASSDLKSYFIVDNWTTSTELNYSNQLPEGMFNFPIDAPNAKWLQVKVELRGYETCVEEWKLINVANKQT